MQRLDYLELMIKANSDSLNNFAERTGQTFARQTFTIKQLSERWQCSESEIRNIIRDYKMRLLRGKNNKIRVPYMVWREDVIKYENDSLPIFGKKKRRTKPADSWEIKAPAKVQVDTKALNALKSGVRRLGEL